MSTRCSEKVGSNDALSRPKKSIILNRRCETSSTAGSSRHPIRQAIFTNLPVDLPMSANAMAPNSYLIERFKRLKAVRLMFGLKYRLLILTGAGV